jgi:murein DD-endopeptidase MepM/ murein hydrolase activator NlpD
MTVYVPDCPIGMESVPGEISRIPSKKRRAVKPGLRELQHLIFGMLLLLIIPTAAGCGSATKKPIASSHAKRPGVYHTVKRHQTLWRISKTYKVDMAEVARVNGIKDVNKIKAGQKIFIPGAKRVVDVGIYIEDLSPAGRKQAKVDLAREKGRFIWPVRGPIRKGFGMNKGRKHDGIDISAPHGTPIRSAASGQVLYSGNEIKGYGNIVIIKHARVVTSVYAHNAVNLVREGDRLAKGQIIAKVGRTGRATGDHLHFEIRNHSRPINPLLVLPQGE